MGHLSEYRLRGHFAGRKQHSDSRLKVAAFAAIRLSIVPA